MENLLSRFLSYVKIDTQSNPHSKTTPSSEKQLVLAKKLVFDLHQIGLTDVTLDQNGYIMATLPANTDKEIPTIGFISHYDTSPDFTAHKVNPQIIENYDGGIITLNRTRNIVLDPAYFEDLKQYQGQTIITTDGTTLLGADDKAGVAEIITAMEYLLNNPDIEHGTIRIGFTPDEEIGRGAHKFDVAKFGAQWAYTMDGSQIGELEYENFNAAGATIKIKGKSVHPGYAKNKMVNAIGIANEFLSLLPQREVPEHTEGREGFFHVHHIQGGIESATIELIVRDHDADLFEARKELLASISDKITARHGDCITVEIQEQYRNMREKIEPVFHIVELAEAAMKALDITPIIKPIRGGTDGSQLSFMGLPCPNIFAGGHNFHGKYEYVPLESMQKAVLVICKNLRTHRKKICLMDKTQQVEAYYQESHLFKEGINLLRQLAQQTEAIETLKWRMPVYTIGNKNVFGIVRFKHHFGIWFFNGAFMQDSLKVLQNAQEGKTKGMRSWKFNSINEIKEASVLNYLNEAITNQKEGKFLVTRKVTKELVIPDLLVTAFKNDTELKTAFDKFTHYKQKEFCEYITEAKQDKTKQKRLAKISPMIKVGIGLADKYRS